MNRSLKLLEFIQSLLETDLFKSHGFQIDSHILPSPSDKKMIMRRRKIVAQHQKLTGPKARKRIVTIYKHDGQHYGSIEHQLSSGHPLDITYYSLNKSSSNEQIKKAERKNR